MQKKKTKKKNANKKKEKIWTKRFTLGDYQQ